MTSSTVDKHDSWLMHKIEQMSKQLLLEVLRRASHLVWTSVLVNMDTEAVSASWHFRIQCEPSLRKMINRSGKNRKQGFVKPIFTFWSIVYLFHFFFFSVKTPTRSLQCLTFKVLKSQVGLLLNTVTIINYVLVWSWN